MDASAPTTVADPARRMPASPPPRLRDGDTAHILRLFKPGADTPAAPLDALTGLCSQARFMRDLPSAIAAAGEREACTLLYLDLDAFGQVNEAIGRDGGDAILREVARRLTDTVGPNDVVARFEGDDFVVLTTGASSADRGTYLAQRIRTVFSRAFTHQGGSLRVGVSCGIARFPRDARGAVLLLRCAQTALCGAKQAGGDRYQIGRATRPRRFADWSSPERASGMAAGSDGY